MTRRAALQGALVGAPWLVQNFVRPEAYAEAARRLSELEAERGGRLGVAVLDGSGGRIAHHGGVRFPMSAARSGCQRFTSRRYAAFASARLERSPRSRT